MKSSHRRHLILMGKSLQHVEAALTEVYTVIIPHSLNELEIRKRALNTLGISSRAEA
jgi:hypothetical protein